eukprot:56553-Rhodomonas_salina.2
MSGTDVGCCPTGVRATSACGSDGRRVSSYAFATQCPRRTALPTTAYRTRTRSRYGRLSAGAMSGTDIAYTERCL